MNSRALVLNCPAVGRSIIGVRVIHGHEHAQVINRPTNVRLNLLRNRVIVQRELFVVVDRATAADNIGVLIETGGERYPRNRNAFIGLTIAVVDIEDPRLIIPRNR